VTTWHIVDAEAIWVKEFAAALAAVQPTKTWIPRRSMTGAFENWEREEGIADPPLHVLRFPLQRGFARLPYPLFDGIVSRLAERLAAHSEDPARSPLVCTSPYYAPLATRWPGPVIYYVTDLNVAYESSAPSFIRALERQICPVAALVCPNSRRIGEYLASEAGCDRGKIEVLPNATRACNISPVCLWQPSALPADVSDLPRPVIGVIGNLAGNMNWDILVEVVRRTPDFSWVFVGPTEMRIHDREQSQKREWLKSRGGRVRFTGPKPYGELQEYARAFDAAVLPYRRIEPTFSGSATRFYEHVAACRPIIATRGVEELWRLEPLLRLADTPEEMVNALLELRAVGFRDGQEQARWKMSLASTWQARASAMLHALSDRKATKFAYQ
jgi:glycosyltransferase involved in cell wall biosynthesis